MMHSDRLLHKILRLSQRMHELARGGEWDAIVRLEQERQGLTKQCFAADSTFSDAQVAAQRIRRIVGLNQEILEIGAHDKSEIGHSLFKLLQGRNAIKAYKHCSR